MLPGDPRQKNQRTRAQANHLIHLPDALEPSMVSKKRENKKEVDDDDNDDGITFEMRVFLSLFCNFIHFRERKKL